jgi:hypothetical protein
MDANLGIAKVGLHRRTGHAPTLGMAPAEITAEQEAGVSGCLVPYRPWMWAWQTRPPWRTCCPRSWCHTAPGLVKSRAKSKSSGERHAAVKVHIAIDARVAAGWRPATEQACPGSLSSQARQNRHYLTLCAGHASQFACVLLRSMLKLYAQSDLVELLEAEGVPPYGELCAAALGHLPGVLLRCTVKNCAIRDRALRVQE